MESPGLVKAGIAESAPKLKYTLASKVGTIDLHYFSNPAHSPVIIMLMEMALMKKMALPGIEWVILGDHRAGSMQVRTLRRRYSSLRNP